MRARFRHLLFSLGETFWLLPGLMVAGGVVGAMALVRLDRAGVVPAWLINSPWLYNGGGTGARTLLGAVASSMIGVAGTVFSITIASLSLAAGQMGPRLLRNFVQDRGNQFTLGALLGTFCYALMVLRSVRTEGEGVFVPYMSLNIGIVLAFLCVGTLVFFVGHMAGRINVDTVLELVSADVEKAICRLTTTTAEPPPPMPPEASWQDAAPVADPRRGYLQHLDAQGLAGWAAAHGARIRMLARPGSFVFPGAPIALALPAVEGGARAIRDATVVGSHRINASDLEFAVRQLVEVAVRASSSGNNDPHTVASVLDRLGSALCILSGRHLPEGRYAVDRNIVLEVPTVTYDGLADAMFHEIRQNAGDDVSILARLLEVIASVLACEKRPEAVAALRRHAGLVLADAERTIQNPSDLEDVRARHRRVEQAAGVAPARPGAPPVAAVPGTRPDAA
ncbi:DUF2254 domain-containing protein [Rhizosaccharibacter radicis]|uniref:DUF2254 domain-containing protein n=1 Tax=Rhizosaccharibacter radicis TaxID=2782605 RepID=A0ABT1VZN2_9PROT|nr:DUF2254 domain-containing protein [Acetobacteraceae bacterium KSS12]